MFFKEYVMTTEGKHVKPPQCVLTAVWQSVKRWPVKMRVQWCNGLNYASHLQFTWKFLRIWARIFSDVIIREDCRVLWLVSLQKAEFEDRHAGRMACEYRDQPLETHVESLEQVFHWRTQKKAFQGKKHQQVPNCLSYWEWFRKHREKYATVISSDQITKCFPCSLFTPTIVYQPLLKWIHLSWNRTSEEKWNQSISG